MMVVPPPSAIIPSCDSPPEADRGEKTAAKPIPVIKTSRATRYLLGNFTSPGMFCPFQRSFAGGKEPQGHRSSLPTKVILSVPQGEGFFSTSGEQSAVALVTNLREVANSRCWVSNELEAIFWRWCERRLRLWCHHRYGYGGGVLDEIAAESRPVVERPPLRYALPLNTERLEESAYQSQGVKRVQAVRHRERVEYAANVLYVQNCLAFIQVHLHASLRDLNSPKTQSWRNPGVVRMQAQRARCYAVNSYESK